MNDQVNAIIDNLCEKFGTTVQYLVPELARYEIARGIADLFFDLIIFTCGVLIFRKIQSYLAELKETEDVGEEYMLYCIPALFWMYALISFHCSVIDLAGWISSPMAATVKMILGMMR